MSTLYKSELFHPSVTTLVTLYTCPEEVETIVKGVQVSNHGNNNIDFEVIITRSGVDYEISHKVVGSKTSVNALDTTVVLEAGDILKTKQSVVNDIAGAMSYMEIRSDTKNPI